MNVRRTLSTLALFGVIVACGGSDGIEFTVRVTTLEVIKKGSESAAVRIDGLPTANATLTQPPRSQLD